LAPVHVPLYTVVVAVPIVDAAMQLEIQAPVAAGYRARS